MKAITIVSGILTLLLTVALAVFWTVILYPGIIQNPFSANSYSTLRVLEMLGVITIPWTTEIIPSVTLEQLYWLVIFITSQPTAQVNILNIITIESHTLMAIIVMALGLSGILALASTTRE